MTDLNQLYPRQWHGIDNTYILDDQVLQIENLILSRQFEEALRHTKNLPESMRSRKNRFVNRIKYLESRRMRGANKIIKISFYGFWDSFPITSNPIKDFLFECGKQVKQKVIIEENHNDADIIITSCYRGNTNHLNNHSLRIGYLPEPVLPSYEEMDYTISQFEGKMNGRNIHIPLYVWEIQANFVSNYYKDKLEQPVDKQVVYMPQATKEIPKKDFCIIAGNSNPMRLEIINQIESCGYIVDKYGPAFNRQLKCKDDLRNHYKFHICPESQILPGYISEKVIRAKACYAVPIYIGSTNENSPINPKAIINWESEASKFINELRKVGELNEYYNQKMQEPLLIKPFKFDKIINQMGAIMGQFLI